MPVSIAKNYGQMIVCGIFGFNSQKVDESKFFELMAHRGPDASGAVRHQDWLIGHLRLAIIDIRDAANQPFVKDGSLLVFNGEIYNYEELKSQYFPSRTFATNSDTELLISMLNEFGMSALNKLNGMFAFAYLSSDGELFLARDRYGVKPLYYYQTDETFLFSSEIKPILGVMGSAQLDASIVETFKADTATDFDYRSGYLGVNAVERGSYLHLDKSKNRRVCKWYFGRDSKVSCEKTDKYKEKCEEILTDAIKLRCRADVPLAITLSGGIDSTTIYTLIKEKLSVDVQPFIFSHKSEATDESALAIKLAKYYGDKPIVIQQDGDYLADLKAALYHLEFPIWNPSAIAYFSMYRAIAQRGYKVVIEGHGADEQLGGYSYMIRAALKEAFKNHNFLFFLQVYKVLHLTNHSGLGQKIIGLEKLKNFFLTLHSLKSDAPTFEEILRDSFDYKILPMVLRAFDRLSMAHSIESRMPFMDFQFVEFARSLPLEHKVNGLGSKAILREILKSYGHQEIYLNKAKMGFSSDLPDIFKDTSIKDFFIGLCQNLNCDNRYHFVNQIRRGVTWDEVDDIWKETSIEYYNTRQLVV